MLGCGVGSWPLTYLGLPLGGNPKAASFWNPVIERTEKRWESWKKAGGINEIFLWEGSGGHKDHYLPIKKKCCKDERGME